jgi:CheY-like chemotaxis protein
MKILLCEDDLFLNELYSDLIKSAGYELETATDGDIAFQRMHQGGYDLVLLDMMMPGMTGLQVLDKLKTEPSLNANKKIVFLTNSDNPKDVESIKKVSDGYLLKSSMTPDQFIENVKKYL